MGSEMCIRDRIVERDRELGRIDRGRREADLPASLHHPIEHRGRCDARGRRGEALGAGTEVFTLDEKDKAGQPSDDNDAAEQAAANDSSACANAGPACMAQSRHRLQEPSSHAPACGHPAERPSYVRASVVSPLIHSRYLSRPASTGSARSSGTL